MIEKGEIKRFFERQQKSPKSFRDVCLHFNPSPPERRALKRLIRQLVDEGFLIRNRKGQYSLFSEAKFFTGFFEAHRDGYGFVILEEIGQKDIFIPAKSVNGAMDQDKVIVRLDSKARQEGCIVKIVERGRKKVIGVLDRNRGGYYIRPKEAKITYDFFVSPKDLNDAKEGDLVIADIRQYPDARCLPTACNLKVITPPKSPTEHLDMIIKEAEITEEFSINSKKLDIKPRATKRKDLRDLITITIDGENARDFDDAISIQKSNDGYRLWVHIADVSDYVLWDTPLDLEARARGNSYYLPDRVIPMLPKILSDDICSLKPRVDRLTFTVEMLFDNDGKQLSSDFYLSTINSNERMTYTTVNEIITNPNSAEVDRYEYLIKDLYIMAELCQLLRKRRKQRGSPCCLT